MDPNVSRLLGIVQSQAPNGLVQETIAHNLRRAQADGMDERGQLVMLANVLTDGLNYGNWPLPVG